MSGRKIWNIPGGIHPEEHKQVSNGTPIQSALMPSRLVLPLQQHIGAIAEPIVKVGDSVLKGALIASAKTVVSANVHAPTSGTVTAIDHFPIQHPSGFDNLCIEITPDHKDEWIPHSGTDAFWELAPDTLLKTIQASGIIGMGGAGFPSHVKLHPEKSSGIRSLILNGVECEPYITADDRLMRERAEQILYGGYVMAYLIQPSEMVIAIEDNKPEAIAAMKAAVNKMLDHPLQISPILSKLKVEVVSIPTKYPSGGEKQIIHIITGKEVPSGGLPAQVGVTCQNVGTAYAVQKAIQLGEPLISRITTFTGEGFYKPGNYEVLIGTPVDEMFDQTAAREHRIKRLIMGGSMMGFSLHSAKAPIVKTTNCIIAATIDDFEEPKPEQPCIRCGACTDACPAGLLPQQLYWHAKSHNFEQAQHHNLFDCIECGACAYVCPSSIPLVQYYRFAKGEIRSLQLEHEKADRSRIRFEARNERLAKEQAEKEARRKERAQKAAALQKAKAIALKEKESAPSQNQAAYATNDSTSSEPPSLLQLETTVNKAEKKWKDSNKALQDKIKRGDSNITAYQNKVSVLKEKLDKAKQALASAKTADLSKDNAETTDTASPLQRLMIEAAQARTECKKLSNAIQAAEAKQSPRSKIEQHDQEIAQLKARLDTAQAKSNQLQSALMEAKATSPNSHSSNKPNSEPSSVTD